MENFRPPAMEEVKKQQTKSKIIIIGVVFLCLIGLFAGGYIGSKHLAHYFNQLTVESKYLLLKEFFQAVIDKDIEKQYQLAPEFSLSESYNFLQVGGSYMLFMFAGSQVNDNSLLFNIIDQSVQPSISYLSEVIYATEEENGLVIKNIITLNVGHQIEP